MVDVTMIALWLVMLIVPIGIPPPIIVEELPATLPYLYSSLL